MDYNKFEIQAEYWPGLNSGVSLGTDEFNDDCRSESSHRDTMEEALEVALVYRSAPIWKSVSIDGMGQCGKWYALHHWQITDDGKEWEQWY